MSDQSSPPNKHSDNKLISSCLLSACVAALVTTGTPILLTHALQGKQPKPDPQNPSSGVIINIYQSGPKASPTPAVVVNTTGNCLDLKVPVQKPRGP